MYARFLGVCECEDPGMMVCTRVHNGARYKGGAKSGYTGAKFAAEYEDVGVLVLLLLLRGKFECNGAKFAGELGVAVLDLLLLLLLRDEEGSD